MNNNLIINNIQRFCFHDGPGVRTTVFLHSCPLKCPWCANPESNKNIHKYVVNDCCKLKNDKCFYGLSCIGKKDNQEHLKTNYHICPVGAIEQTRKLISIEDLENIILQDKLVYGIDGGVTFSGGEPLQQSQLLSILLKKLKKQKINISIETCLFVDSNKLLDIIDFVDLFIVDIKILDSKESLKILNGDISLFLKNIELLFENNKQIIFRIPLINPFVTNNKNINKIYDFLKIWKPLKVELMQGHNLAREKYHKLNIPYKNVKTISNNQIETIKKEIQMLDIEVEILKF